MIAAWKAFTAFCDLVPGWVWAIACAVLLAAFGGTAVQRDIARADAKHAIAERDQARGELGQLKAAVTAMKKQAAEDLEKARAEVADWQARYNGARRAQEIQDANAQSAIDKARHDLRAASDRNGGRLRDPWAAGCGSSGASTGEGSRAGAGTGADSRPETGGLLSERFTSAIERLQSEADEVNRAYIACRPDSFRVRGLPVPAMP